MEINKSVKEFVDKCHTDFWYYPKRAFCLMLWVFTIMAAFDGFLVNTASAESGSITVSNETHPVYISQAGTTTLNSVHQENFTQFWFDMGNYTSLTNYTITDVDKALTYEHASEVTTFTCVQNCTGSGTASYSQSLGTLNWVYGSVTITGSPFKIAYSHPIYLNISIPGADLNNHFIEATAASNPVGFVNATQPMFVFNQTPGSGLSLLTRLLVGGVTHNIINSGIFSSGTVTNFYSCSYPASGWVVCDITKTGQTVLTKDSIHSQTNKSVSYETENTFNNGSVSFMAQQTDGVYINVTMQTGDFTDRLINSSGIGSLPTFNHSNPNTANCDVNCIETSKPTYNNTESVNIYGSFYPANTTVTECLFFGFICEDKTINTESTTGYVFISTQGSTSPIKFLSFLTDQHNNYNQFTDLDIGTYQAQLYGFAAPGSTCTNGIVYDFPFIPLGCYYPHNITTFTVVNASGNLSIVWQTKLSNSSAIYGDTITVAWNNVTANDTVVIYDNNGSVSQFYNINQSTVSQIPVFIPLYTIGTWNATIYNASNHNHNATAFLNVLPPGAVDVNNSFGITMYWSKATDVINTPTQLNWNTGTYTGFYNISILLDGKEVRRTAFTGAPGQMQQASYSFNVPGAYIAQFMDINNTVQQQATIRIANTISKGGQPAVPTGSDAAASMGNNLLIFMSQPAFWGVILWFVVVVIVAMNKQNAGVIGLVFAAVEAVIGLFDPYRWYVLVIVIVILGILFMVGKKTTSEG